MHLRFLIQHATVGQCIADSHKEGSKEKNPTPASGTVPVTLPFNTVLNTIITRHVIRSPHKKCMTMCLMNDSFEIDQALGILH